MMGAGISNAAVPDYKTLVLRHRYNNKVFTVVAAEFDDEYYGKALGQSDAWHWSKSIWEPCEVEHEVANIGRLTITVTRYLGKHSREWRTDVNFVAYDNHIAFSVETTREVVEALNKAIIIAEGYEGK